MPVSELLDGENLDYDAYVILQEESYRELLEKRGASSAFITDEYYRWKYHAAAGVARIAVVREGGRYLAANAMTPMLLRNGGQSVRGWHSGETATAPDQRGKGLFKECLSILVKSLEDDEIFFGFPNENSKKGFLKIGWEDKGIVTTWVRTRPVLDRRDSKFISEPEEFGEAADELARRIAEQGFTTLDHGADYLNWRYVRHPLYSYKGFLYDDELGGLGVAISREAELYGRKATLAMTVFGTTARIERELLFRVARWARYHGSMAILMMDSALGTAHGLRARFAPVWSRVLPKKQLLMGRATPGEGRAERLMGARWRVQLGDWDVF